MGIVLNLNFNKNKIILTLVILIIVLLGAYGFDSYKANKKIEISNKYNLTTLNHSENTKEKPVTHTLMNNGKFHIPNDKIDKLYKKIEKYLFVGALYV